MGGALLFTFCSQNEVQINTLSKMEIVFSKFSDKIANENSKVNHINGANTNGDNYKVFAKSELNSSNWFINDEIYGQGDNSNKPKGGPYYWITSKEKINFYAYAPAEFAKVKGETISRTKVITKADSKQELLINYIVPPTANEDFTIASPIYNSTYEQTNGTVTFNFQHVLAKVNISVKLSDLLAKSGYTLEKGYSAQLSVAKNKGTIDPTASIPTWTNLSLDSDITSVYRNDTTYTIIPQSATSCIVQIQNVTIKKGGVTVFPSSTKSTNLKPYAIKEGDVKINGFANLDNLFAMGKQYNLKFTINNLSTDENNEMVFGKEIQFNSNTASWTDTSSLNK